MVFPVIGGDGKPTGYEIDNSLRFNDDDGADLGRAPSADGNRKTFTFSTWLKIGNIPSADYDFFSANSTNNFNDVMRIRSDETLQISAKVSGNNDNGYKFRSDMKFRDPSAWYHIVVGVDTTQATNSNGLKVYVNGSLISGTYDSYNQNISTSFNKDGSTMAIGHTQNDGGNHYDGYISETHFIDGTQLDSSYFGETNDNGVWIPKEYTGSYGTNGFFLEYQQTGTSQNSSGIGADTSGNDHHFSVTNLAAIDVTVDTSTNNFATINPLDPYHGGTLSEGNCKFVTNGSTVSPKFSTIGVSSGKWYCEMVCTDADSSTDFSLFGIASTEVTASNQELGNFANDWGYWNRARLQNNNSYSNYGNTYAVNDIVGIALDLDNNKLYFSINGTFQNSGDPTSGATGTGAISITDPSSTGLGFYFFALGDFEGSSSSNQTLQANFGNAPFSISSGNSDANGYGNFEYAPPSGYYSLCTKNLAEYG